MLLFHQDVGVCVLLVALGWSTGFSRDMREQKITSIHENDDTNSHLLNISCVPASGLEVTDCKIDLKVSQEFRK